MTVPKKNEPIIEVKHLSKQYNIGVDRTYKTLSDSLTCTIKNPLKTLKESLKQNNTFWALKDVNFKIEKGEVVGIIGRNGAGKSTLLKILSRITHPTEGEIIMRGRVGSLLEVGTGFHPELSGRENIYFNGAILGMKKREIDEKFDEIVKFSGVEKFLDTPVKRYSSGMNVRLAFSVAAHLDPEILVVDEVLAVGDIEFQRKCLGRMEKISNEGRTVLFVSHNMAAIGKICNRCMLLSKGNLEYDADSESTIEYYSSHDHIFNMQNGGVFAKSTDNTILIKYIGTVSKNDERGFFPRSGQEIKILIDLYSEKEYVNVAISIAINNNLQLRICLLHSEISGSKLSLRKGNNKIICTVENNPLIEGIYNIDLKIIYKNSSILWAPNIGKICIETGDFFNSGRLPDLRWGGLLYIKNSWKNIVE